MTKKFLAIKVILVLILLTAMPSISSDKVFQVAVVPFKVQGSDKLQYLRDGIFDMVSSRLFVSGRIHVLSKEKAILAASHPESVGDLDYLVTGTINSIGNHYSIDARLVDVEKNQMLLTSSYSQKTLDDLIPWVEKFSKEIRDKILPRDFLSAVPAPIPGQSGPAPDSGSEVSDLSKTGDLLNPEFIRQFRSKALIPKFWRSQEFPTIMRGMDVGDVDGDGRNETVIIDEDNLWVYRNEDRLVEIFHHDTSYGTEFLSLDVADFNGNGLAEIYVSAMNRFKMESFVVEYDGSTFRLIAEKLDHHVRVAHIQNDKTMLVGQNHSMDSPFFGPIYRLEWRGKELKRGADLKLPINPSVFAFAKADIISEQKGNLLVVDAGDKLRIYDEKGKLKWRSRDYYGGSAHSRKDDEKFERSQQEAKDLDISKMAYTPLRILVRDLNGDNQTEVLINRNIEAFGKILERMRIFTGGEIHNLVWDGLTLTTSWKTRKFDGYIADFQVKDIDNDGEDELVIALVLRVEAIDILKKRSAIIAYDLNLKSLGSEEKNIDNSVKR